MTYTSYHWKDGVLVPDVPNDIEIEAEPDELGELDDLVERPLSKLHSLVIFYTVDDDGIHVGCKAYGCELDEVLGFDPGLEACIKAGIRHWDEVRRAGRP